jgi:hypothetical protein
MRLQDVDISGLETRAERAETRAERGRKQTTTDSPTTGDGQFNGRNPAP